MSNTVIPRGQIRRYLGRIFTLLICAVYVVANISSSVAALSEKQKSLYRNGVYYYELGCSVSEEAAKTSNTAQAGGVFILGDSIMQGAYYGTQELKKAFDEKKINAIVDAQGSRSIKDHAGQDVSPSPPNNSKNKVKNTGLDALEPNKEAITDAKNIVIELGTNQDGNGQTSVYKANITDLIQKIRATNGTASIFVVNIFSRGLGNMDSHNSMLEKLSKSLDFSIIDTTKTSIPLDGEKIHPRDAPAYKKYSALIANALSKANHAPPEGLVDFNTGMSIDADGSRPKSPGDTYIDNTNLHTNGSVAKKNALNADNINFVALAPIWAENNGVKLGDLLLVEYKDKKAFAVYGDVYKGSSVHGEGSIRLAKSLGIPSSPTSGGVESGVKYTVYKGSHKELEVNPVVPYGEAATPLTPDKLQNKIDEVGAALSGQQSSGESDPTTTPQSCKCTENSNDAAQATGETALSPRFPKGADPDETAKNIDDYIKSIWPGSPFAGKGSVFVKAGQKYDINPGLVVLIAQKESSLGKAIPSGSFNSYGRRASSSQPQVSGGWYKYDSFEGSIDPQTKYMREQYVDNMKLTTIQDIMNRYAPPSENDTSGYIAFIKSAMSKIIKVNDSGSTSSPSGASSGSISSRVGKGINGGGKEKLKEAIVNGANKFKVAPNLVAGVYYVENFVGGDSLVNGASSVNTEAETIRGDGNWRDPAAPYGSGQPYNTSGATAAGPFQFIPSTWAAHGQDGNGDGKKEIQDLFDGAAGASEYLASLGAKIENEKGGKNSGHERKHTWRGAIFGYNNSDGYVENVMNTYDYLEEGGSDSVGGSGCDTAGSASTGGADGFELSGKNAMVSYEQADPKWGGKPYGAGKASIAEAGCGPTSVAMVVATLTGKKVTPLDTANRYGGQFHVSGQGSSWGLFPQAAKDYGLEFSDLGTNLDDAAKVIREGGLVIMSASAGHFTGGGHIMVIRKVSPDGNSFYFADSNGKGKNGDSETRAFSKEFLLGEGGMKHVWGYKKK